MYLLENSALLTDFYELTMMQGYFYNNPKQEAVFEMLFRHNPFNGGYTIFAGLDNLLEFLEEIEFTGEDIDYLNSLGIFKSEFLDFLRGFRFKGTIYSVKEGSLIFPNEPVLRVHAGIIEAQLIESITLNILNFQSLIATKTARIVNAAGNGNVLEFGLRRAQGMNGAISGTRAAFIGGASGTSNTYAGKIFGIPVRGTMAHSWVMSFKSELEAFEKYSEIFPGSCVLLVDTFDTLKSGIPNAIKVFSKKDPHDGFMGIRIDSGDLEYLSKEARKMLDSAGLEHVKILVSSDLDEWIISHLKNSNVPVDAWGVGTKLITGDSEAALPGVYKITAKKEEGKSVPCIKISNNPNKITIPGIKNVMRFYNADHEMLGDLIFLEDEREELLERIGSKDKIYFNHLNSNYAHIELEEYTSTEILLSKVMHKGKRLLPEAPVQEHQTYKDKSFKSLHETYKRLLNPHIYKVSISTNLRDLKMKMINEVSL